MIAMTREPEHSLPLETRRENEGLAIDAADNIMSLAQQLGRDIKAMLTKLEEDTNQGVFDGDWEANLDCLEDALTSRIRNQFKCQ